MEENNFGKLVREYRKQRGWKQEELAERWGFSREYVSQIERGKRKLEKQEQIRRLATILGIPSERLYAMGKINPPIEKSTSNDDVLLQAIFEPAQETVKMSWLIWRENNSPIDVEMTLLNLKQHLTEALSLYNGQFRWQAFKLLAHVYEMLGKMAIERTGTQEAMGYFREMQEVAEELGDAELTANALLHQAEMFRRKGWHETSFRRLDAATKYIKDRGKFEPVSDYIKATLLKAYAISYFVIGDEQNFLRSIESGLTLVNDMPTTLNTLNHEINTIDLLETKAQGHTMLWQPEKALELYSTIDKLKPYRGIRDQSSYDIIKAQAYCYAGDISTGIKHAQSGMALAKDLHSIRYVVRLRQMSDRLNVTPLGKKQPMKDLRGEIYTTLEAMKTKV